MVFKVRFAPSPTGFLHIGNARIAIVNYLFCKKNAGKFLLRIDDTDVLRSKKEYEEAILEDLAWLGIDFDEFFRQSERIERYRAIQNKLIASGWLYECYETQDELTYKRKRAVSAGFPPVYDRGSLRLTVDEKKKLESERGPGYWRFKLPRQTVRWNDLVMKEIAYDLSNVSDPVVVKSDGTFLYAFSSVIDDVDSGITHIIRGQDHVTNTAVQISMFDAISDGAYHVVFGHLSLLVDKNGAQFSKRLGSLNLSDIRKNGVLPMSINNFLAVLGASKDISPHKTIDDLSRCFEIEAFSTNSPKFNIDDVLKFNKKLLRNQSYEDVLEAIGEDVCPSKEVFLIVKENIESLKDYAMWKDIFSHDFHCDYRNLAKNSVEEILKIIAEEVCSADFCSKECVKKIFEIIKAKTKFSAGALFVPIRQALTGLEHGANVVDIMMLLGKDEVLRRLNEACSSLSA